MIGQTVSHYEIVEKLGEGGMGVVYRARDTKLDRDVAIKFLPPQLNSNKKAKTRFIQEAKTASALNHSNIAVIHEIDETPDGQMFIVMAYYDGQTLKDRIEDGPLQVDEALDMASQIALGLATAHDKGILHRDVKPANILLTPSGEVKIADFGLAKLAGQTKLTETGITVGTIAYMSPEQASGEDVDSRSDLFSLGVVLYEMLTGETPFKGDHEAAVLYGIMHSEPAPLENWRSDLPDGSQHLIDQLLAKDRDHRYSNAGDFIEDLRAIKRGTVQLGRHRSRSDRLNAGIFMVLSTVILAVVAYLMFARHDNSMVSQEAPSVLDDRFAIVVAPFWGVTDKAKDEAEVTRALIDRELSSVFRNDNDIKIVRDPQLDAPRLIDEARDLGRRIGANMVVWGEVLALHDEVEIQPHVTVVEPIGPAGQRNVQFFNIPTEELVGSLQAHISEPGQLAQRKEKAWDVANTVLLVAGSYYHHQNRNDKAETLLRRISSLSADGLATLADVVLQRGQVAEAESLVTASLKLDPDSPLTYNILGWVMVRRGELKAALEKFEQAISFDSTYAPSYGNAGLVCLNMGRLDEALDWFDQTLERDPTLAVVYMVKGTVYQMKREFESAEMAMGQAFELDSLYIDPVIRLGHIYFAQGRYEEAIAKLKKALEIDSAHFNVNHWIGYSYQMMKQYEKAVVHYEAELSQHPENTWSYINLGHILYWNGDFEKAANVYKRADYPDRSMVPQMAWFLPYTQVMRLISASRSGHTEEAREDFLTFSRTNERTGWPDPIVDFFAGELSEDSLLVALTAGETTPDEVISRKCEAYYFLGMAHLLGLPGETHASPADSSAAVGYFRECLNTGLTNYNEYIYATQELHRLEDIGL